MRRARLLLSVLVASGVMLGCAGSASKQVAAVKPAVAFSPADRELISNYYGAASPGTRSAVAAVNVGDRLQSGSRPQKLPSDLHSRLKAVPDPYTWYVLGADVVLVNRDTHEIMDVIPQVAR
jgi:hypothetical protein